MKDQLEIQPIASSKWPLHLLGKVAKFLGGGTPSKGRAEFWNGDIPWVSPKDMKFDVVSDSMDKVTPQAVAGSAAKMIPTDSLLIVVRSGILARTVPTALAGRELAINQDLKAICPSKELHPRFLAHFMRASEGQILATVSRGATVHRLSTDVLKSLEIPLPPLEEQKRIVAVLDQAFAALDRARAHAEANLADSVDLMQRSIDEAYAGSPEITGNPLSDFITIGHGFAFKSGDFVPDDDASMPIVLTPGNYHEDAILYFREGKTKRLGIEPPAGFAFESGELTVVMTDLSSKMKILGKPAFIDRDGILHNQRIGRIRFLTDKLVPRYLFYYMRSTAYLSNIRATATGTMVRHTAPKRILSCNIPMLEKDQQNDTAYRLSQIEEHVIATREAIQEKLTDIADLRQSLLQKAFSGQLTV